MRMKSNCHRPLLFPIRANMADTPETSDYTSLQERVRPQFDLAEAVSAQTAQDELRDFSGTLKPLLSFDHSEQLSPQSGIPCAFEAYLELVDWTGRSLRDDKRGAIDHSLPPILQRLEITPQQWMINTTRFEALHRRLFNRPRHLRTVS